MQELSLESVKFLGIISVEFQCRAETKVVAIVLIFPTALVSLKSV
jgi:hypothetical protein